MATVVRADGRWERLLPNDGATFSLRELQAVVGGYIEIVRAHDGQWLVLNEDGKRLGLPVNIDATALIHLAGGLPDDIVVGDVLWASDVEVGANENEGDDA